MASRSSPEASTPEALDPALAQKRRARRRVVGAAALALSAAALMPLVFDAEPRHQRADIQVRIPSRDTPIGEKADAGDRAAQPSGSSAGVDEPGNLSASSGSNVTMPPSPADSVPPADGKMPAEPRPTAAGETRVPEPQAAESATTAPVPVPSPPPSPTAKPPAKAPAVGALDPKRESKPESRPEPKSKPADAKGPGFLLQVGAFASDKAAQDQVDRLRKLGMKSYTETIKTPNGERVRVRLGPYDTRDLADQARARLRNAGVDVTLIGP